MADLPLVGTDNEYTKTAMNNLIGRANTNKIDIDGVLAINPRETVGWDDLKAPATTIRQGATSKPEFDTTNLGLLFPQDDDTEIAYIILQFPHNRKAGSNIRPHIHFIQTGAEEPVFKMQYKWYNNGSEVPATFTDSTATGFVFDRPDPEDDSEQLQIVEFDEIDGSGITGVSSIFECKLFRDDDVVTGNVLLKEFDIHYQIDQDLGSRQEYVKWSDNNKTWESKPMDETNVKEELHKIMLLIEKQNTKIDAFIEKTIVIEQQIKDRPTLGCIKEFKSIVEEEFRSKYDTMKSVHQDWHDKENANSQKKIASKVGNINNIAQIGTSLFPYIAFIAYFIIKNI